MFVYLIGYTRLCYMNISCSTFSITIIQSQPTVNFFIHKLQKHESLKQELTIIITNINSQSPAKMTTNKLCSLAAATLARMATLESRWLAALTLILGFLLSRFKKACHLTKTTIVDFDPWLSFERHSTQRGERTEYKIMAINIVPKINRATGKKNPRNYIFYSENWQIINQITTCCEKK